MLAPDISLSIANQRPTCVLDPALALASREAPFIVLRLAKLLDLWVPRAFWQILDASDFIEQKQSCFMKTQKSGAGSEESHRRLLEYCDTIKIWQSLRSRRDATGLGLRWLGDKLEESSLGPDTDFEAIMRYEILAESIAKRHSGLENVDPLSLEYAAVDALALAAAIGSRFVIALAGSSIELDPMGCQGMSLAKVPVKRIDASESSILISREREQIGDLLAWGGASMWSFKGTAIAIVQVIAPRIWEKSICGQEAAISLEFSLPDEGSEASHEMFYPDYWDDAKVFWYLID